MIGALIGAGLSAASAIAGGIASSKAAQKANGMIAQQQKDNQAWYDRNYNEDATQRADAQRILQLTQQAYKDRNKAAQGAQAVMGGTEDSVAATKQANAQGMADAASQIAANGAARKDAVEQQYLGQKNALTQQQVNVENNRAQNIAAATGQAGTALAGMGSSFDETDAANRIDKSLFKKLYPQEKEG